MSKFGGIFARKSSAFDQLAQPSPTAVETPLPDNSLVDGPRPQTESSLPDNPLEIDEELFTSLGAQIGGDNESLRNLLLDASAKISELDGIKAAVSKLADPVGKALRAFEAERSEKINLQTVLNNTRTAYGKLRNEVGELEKKLAMSEKDCNALRQELGTTQNTLRTVEATKAEIAIDIAARRAQIADLEGRLGQETTEATTLREENRRLNEKMTAANKRIITLESDINAARQRLLMADDEKRAQQASIDKMSAEAARLTRKLTETEASLNAAQGRLRQTESNFAEVNNERARLVTALDESNERHTHELSSQRMRFEALQARASATDNLLGEAREHLLARAEEIRDYDRRLTDTENERDNLQARVSDMEADRIRRESELKELDHTRSTLMERSGALTRAYASKEAALSRAEEAVAALTEQVERLTAEKANDKQLAEQAIEELGAALRREKLDRAVVEGALETARKDFARVMREVMNLQRLQEADEPPANLDAANAA
jgi:chromosome segregation ATPase